MKIKPLILLFLAVSVSFSVSYCVVARGLSSGNPSLNSASTAGQTKQDPLVIKNSPSSINISGDLVISGKSVLTLAGVSPSEPVQVYLNGSIYVNDNATLVLRYATLDFMGATEPYSRNITLSSPNGHPRLNITSSVIDAYTSASLVYGHSGHLVLKASASYGAAIYAYNSSVIVAQQLTFYRQVVYSNNFSLGGPTEIACYGNSSASLTSVKVDSALVRDEASITIYTGTGYARSSGILFGAYNSSTANLYAVTLANTMVTNSAHLVLTNCKEATASMITAAGASRVNCTGGTALAGFQETVNGRIVYAPGINVTGYSYVSFSSSTASCSNFYHPVVCVYDHATFAVVQKGLINTGEILAFGSSNVVLNNTPLAMNMYNIGIIGVSSARISVFNCTFWTNPRPVTISLSGTSDLSLVNSSISGGWITLSGNSSLYISGSTLSTCRIASQNNSSVTVANGSKMGDSIEMSNSSSLVVGDSSVSLIYSLDSSQTSLVDSSVSQLSVNDNPTLTSTSSTIKELSFTEWNVTGSLYGLTSFLENLTVALPGGGFRMNALSTTVDGYDFTFLGNSNVTISNSTLRNLSLQGSSYVTLRNSSVYAGCYVVGSSRVVVYSSLRIRCIDSFGNPIEGSEVMVTIGPSARLIGNGTTDGNGWASLVLFSGIINATRNFPLGTVTVAASYQGVSTLQDVSIALANKDVTLSLSLPWWSSYILPVVILVVVVAILSLIYYVIRRVRWNKEKPYG
jgi:hypothetical protein